MNWHNRIAYSGSNEGSGGELLSTEDSIFSTIPGLDDDTSSNETDETSSPPQTNKENAAQNNGTTQTADAGNSAEQSATANSSEKSTEPTNPAAITGPVRPDGLVSVRDPVTKASNLIDPKTGAIIVAAGKERRFYDAAQQAAQKLHAATEELTTLRAQVQAYTTAQAAPQQYGLNPEQTTAAMRIMSDFNKDPSGTLEKVITELLATGVKLPWLENPALLNTGAIEQLIDRKLGPIAQQREQQTQQAEWQAQAQKELDTFLTRRQNAQVHLPVISSLIEKNPGMSLEQAYAELMEYALENGLSMQTSFREQLAARTTTNGTQNPLSNGQTNSPANAANGQRLPLPNGRSANDGAIDRNTVVEAAGDSSWEDITNALRREFSQQ